MNSVLTSDAPGAELADRQRGGTPMAERPTWATTLMAVALVVTVTGLAAAVAASRRDPAVILRAVAVGAGAASVLASARMAVRWSGRALVGVLAVVGSVLLTAAHVLDLVAWHSTARGWHDPADIGVAVIGALMLTLLLAYLAIQPNQQLTSGGRAAVTTGAVVNLGLAAVELSWPTARATLLVVSLGLMVVWGLGLSASAVRRGPALGRRRFLMAVVSSALAAEVLLVSAGLDLLTGWPHRLDAVAWALLSIVAAVTALNLSRHVKVGLDRVAAGLVAALGLTVVVGGAYGVIVAGFLGTPARHDRSVLALSLVAGALAAILVLPARRWSTRITETLAMGESPGSVTALRAFPSRMTRAVPMDELLQQLVELSRDAFGLRSAEMWQLREGHLELTATVPHRDRPEVVVTDAQRPALSRSGIAGGSFVELWLPGLADGREAGNLRVAPVLHAGDLLGVLALELEQDANGLRPGDEAIVVELARQVGLALHNVELDNALKASLEELQVTNVELRQSRARIVAAGDAERRKLERNLHDGAQQHLVALAVNLRLVRDIVSEDPDGATEMLELLADSVRDAIEELRALAHGIYPPLLVDSGLGEALRAAASRSPLPVELNCGGVGRHSAEAEAAVYFCCLEALQNAAKHAPEAAVVVTVSEDDERLAFLVSDDGPGFDPAGATGGHGHTNMSDRLGAIGGAVDWASAPGAGTRISGWVPASPTGR
jgi:signal transduction histidine kinase